MSMSLGILMAFVTWIHFSRPPSSVLDSLIEAGVVERIFDVISVSGVKSLTRKRVSGPPSHFPLDSSSQEDHFCSCDLPEQLVSSDIPFKLAIIALLLLCDRSTFIPDVPLTVSHTHVTVVNRICTIAAHSLRNYQLNDPKSLLAVSILFFHLADELREMLLPDYEHWVEVSIEGTAHCSSKFVRKYFALTLRCLVPLAPLLLRSFNWKNLELRTQVASPTSDLVGGVFLSQYPLLSERYLASRPMSSAPDQRTYDAVRNREEEMRGLVSKLQSSSEAQTQSAGLSQLLRPYQIKGESISHSVLLMLLSQESNGSSNSGPVGLVVFLRMKWGSERLPIISPLLMTISLDPPDLNCHRYEKVDDP